MGSVEIPAERFIETAERQRAVSLAAKDPKVFLQRLIDREAMIAKALRLGIDQDPEVRRQSENLLIGSLRERLLKADTDAVAVSDDEIETFYQVNAQRYEIPARIQVAMLRLQCRPDTVGDAAARLDRVRQTVLEGGVDGPAFGALAIQNSDHQASRYQEGNIGWLQKRGGPSWLPDVAIAEAWRLPAVGDVSTVIRDERAVYLLRLIESKAPAMRPLDEVRAGIRAELLATRRQALEAEFLDHIRRETPTVVYPDELEAAAERLRHRADHPDNTLAPPALP